MRVNPKLANLQYLYANDQTATGLPEGTFVNLAATKYVKDNDANGDKTLSVDEVTLSQEAFDKLDADKNGKLDQTEMRTALKGQDAAIAAYYTGKTSKSGATDWTSSLLGSSTGTADSEYSTKAAANYIDTNDKNADDSLARSETALSQASFNKLDTDGDGKLELGEVQTAIKAKEQTFKTYYTNSVSNKTIANLTSSLLKTI